MRMQVASYNLNVRDFRHKHYMVGHLNALETTKISMSLPLQNMTACFLRIFSIADVVDSAVHISHGKGKKGIIKKIIFSH